MVCRLRPRGALAQLGLQLRASVGGVGRLAARTARGRRHANPNPNPNPDPNPSPSSNPNPNPNPSPSPKQAAAAAAAAASSLRGDLLVLLSARDKSAARRGLVALELGRAATVRLVAWPRSWLALALALAPTRCASSRGLGHGCRCSSAARASWSARWSARSRGAKTTRQARAAVGRSACFHLQRGRWACPQQWASAGCAWWSHPRTRRLVRRRGWAQRRRRLAPRRVD